MDIYKCPKMKIPNTFGKLKTVKLYNKLKKILKENINRMGKLYKI
jgi:hypothetical protein